MIGEVNPDYAQGRRAALQKELERTEQRSKRLWGQMSAMLHKAQHLSVNCDSQALTRPSLLE
jgi:hypothetical protein